MGVIDWLIVLLPLAFVMYMGFYSRRYIVQVSDFLSAGRVCRRYIISAANIANKFCEAVLVEIHDHDALGLKPQDSLDEAGTD